MGGLGELRELGGRRFSRTREKEKTGREAVARLQQYQLLLILLALSKNKAIKLKTKWV